MSPLLLCLALTVFAYAAPPFVPVKPEPVKHAAPPRADPCVDGVNNVVQIADINKPTLRIRTQDAVAQLYDANGNPSCYKGRAKISLPGLVKLVKGPLIIACLHTGEYNTQAGSMRERFSGKVIVTAPSDIRKSGEVLFTYTKNQRFVGTLCKDGKVLNKLIPAEACRQKLYPFIGEEFATMLSTPGSYDMEEIRKTAGVGPMVELPPINSAINMIVRGDWQATLNLVSEGQTIALVKAPSNGEWLYVD